MPELTPAHHEQARRALIVGGYPRPDADGLAQVRWGAVLEAVATAIALAEVRGPAGGRTDPTDAEEAAFGHGLGQAFAECLALLEAPDPAASIRAVAAHYGVTRDLAGPPPDEAATLLHAAASGPPCPFCPSCGQHADEGHLQGCSAGSVPTQPRLVDQLEEAAERRSAAQDRLSWTGSEGLIITPPPADPS